VRVWFSVAAIIGLVAVFLFLCPVVVGVLVLQIGFALRKGHT
jgi:hypothetical protein